MNTSPVTVIRNYWQVLLTLVLLVSAELVVAEEKSVGLVARVSGTAALSRDGEQIEAIAVRQSIFAKDVINTGEDGWITINFFDLTRVVVRPNSEFSIEEFPQTMDGGGIRLDVRSGGARISTGTIATQSPDNFIVDTPNGVLRGSRAEWVVRVCDEDNCQQLESELSRCEDYQSHLLANSQYVAVYKGLVDVDYCPIEQGLGVAQTAILDGSNQSCQVVDEVPCFILFDGKLGRDQARQFMPRLTPAGGDAGERRPPLRPDRPNARTPRPAPRTERPRRPRR